MGNNGSPLDPETLSRLGTLDDPVRRRLYEYVRDCEQPAGRDQAATATEISRTLAAYHLDKLVDAGLLSASYARPDGRSGPGAGLHAGTGQGRMLTAVLSSSGYQPRTVDDGCIELRNCPFHALANEHQDVVCNLNLNLIQGMLAGGNQHDAHAELNFQPNRCCVVIRNAKPD